MQPVWLHVWSVHMFRSWKAALPARINVRVTADRRRHQCPKLARLMLW